MDLSQYTDKELEEIALQQSPVSKMSDKELEAIALQRPDLLERVGQDFSQRSQEAAQIPSYKQTGVEAALQQAGNTAGLVGDVVGQGLSSVFSGIKSVTPEPVKEYIGQKAQDVAQSPMGQFIGKSADVIGEKYGEFKEANPRAARNIEAAGNVATLGLPLGARAKGIEESLTGIGKGVAQKFSPIEKMTSEQIREQGGKLFQLAEKQGAIIKPQFTNEFINDISNLARQTEAGKVFAGETPVEKLIERVQVLRDKPLTFNAAKEIDETLGDLAYSEMKDGKFSADGNAFRDMQSKLRDRINTAPEEFFIGGKDAFETAKEARKYWSASLKLRDIERIVGKAKNMQVPATGIKTGFRTLMDNPNRMKGFTEAERDAISKAAQTGVMTEVLNVFGSRLAPLGAGAAGFASGGIGAGAAAALASQAGSALARKGAEAIQFGKAAKVEDLIRSRLVETGIDEVMITPNVINALKELGIASVPSGVVSAAQEPSIEEIMKMPPEEAKKYLRMK